MRLGKVQIPRMGFQLGFSVSRNKLTLMPEKKGDVSTLPFVLVWFFAIWPQGLGEKGNPSLLSNSWTAFCPNISKNLALCFKREAKPRQANSETNWMCKFLNWIYLITQTMISGWWLSSILHDVFVPVITWIHISLLLDDTLFLTKYF